MATELLTAPESAVTNVEFGELAVHSDADMIDVIVWLDRCMNRLAGLRSQAVDLARAQSESSATGDPTMARRAFTAEIAVALRVSERAAENLIGVGRALGESLPKTLDALQAGEISYRHAQIMVDHAAGLEAADASTLERVVLDKATTITAPRFNSFVRRTRERLNPESIEERHEAAIGLRTVVIDEARDGMAWLSTLLPAAQAQGVFDRLTKAALASRSNRGGIPGDADDTRTLAQRRADILAMVLLAEDRDSTLRPDEFDDSDEFCRWFRGIRAEVILTVPAMSLLDHSSEPATLEGYGPIDIATARRLTARAPSMMRVLTHPETGVALSFGRKKYKVSKDLRTWLRVRDGTCRFPGCGQRASRCDIDHTREWQHGGVTDYGNLAHLCRRHHMLKSAGHWIPTQGDLGDGSLSWVSPSGRSYETQPELRAQPN